MLTGGPSLPLHRVESLSQEAPGWIYLLGMGQRTNGTCSQVWQALLCDPSLVCLGPQSDVHLPKATQPAALRQNLPFTSPAAAQHILLGSGLCLGRLGPSHNAELTLLSKALGCRNIPIPSQWWWQREATWSGDSGMYLPSNLPQQPCFSCDVITGPECWLHNRLSHFEARRE